MSVAIDALIAQKDLAGRGTKEEVFFVQTRRGVCTTTGWLVGQADPGSRTRKRPAGLFQGSPVIGFWKAVKIGLIDVSEDHEEVFCSCCEGISYGMTVFWYLCDKEAYRVRRVVRGRGRTRRTRWTRRTHDIYMAGHADPANRVGLTAEGEPYWSAQVIVHTHLQTVVR